MAEHILIIDDDGNLLAAMRRQLRGRFLVATAGSGEEAVELIASQPVKPAVVLCDMQMGGMNGIETLREIRQRSPDTVRLMLTGNADMQTAIDAINEGAIFRFLTKPTPREALEDCLNAALAQYRLVTAERELLEKTLAGSVKVLSDMLSMAAPRAAGRAARILAWVKKLTLDFKMPYRWQLEVAASLAPLGLMTLPDETVERHLDRRPLSLVEQDLVEQSPEAARNIIANIPRLEPVAAIIHLQNKGYDGSGFPADGPKGADIPVDARILKILNDLASVCAADQPTHIDFDALKPHLAQYDQVLLKRIRECLEVPVPLDPALRPRQSRFTRELEPGMILAQSVYTFTDRLVLTAMTPLSVAHVERLRNQAKLKLISDSISVYAD